MNLSLYPTIYDIATADKLIEKAISKLVKIIPCH